MRHLPIILSAVLASVGLLAVSGQAHAAMPTLSIDRSAVADQPVEKAGYYYYSRRGYYPYYGYRPSTATAITATADPIATVTSKRHGHRSGPAERDFAGPLSFMRLLWHCDHRADQICGDEGLRPCKTLAENAGRDLG
jgi:hypothetical protein